jgi:hypothetical protein
VVGFGNLHAYISPRLKVKLSTGYRSVENKLVCQDISNLATQIDVLGVRFRPFGGRADTRTAARVRVSVWSNARTQRKCEEKQKKMQI